MASVNQLVAEEAISHAVDLQMYSNSVVRRMIAILNRTDDRLFAELIDALSRLDPSSFTIDRLESMLVSVRTLNTTAYAAISAELTTELKDFVQYEIAYQSSVLANFLPAQVGYASVSAEQVYTAALSRPFQGVLLKNSLADMGAYRAKKIRQAIAQGFVEGRTTDQIVRSLRGTQAKGYADGFLQAPRREVEALTRTAVSHMAGFAQDRFVEANQDLIKAVVWHSTLDTRTSEICRVRDQKKYTPVDHKPIGHSLPWLGGAGRAHWGCRSHQTTVLKSFKELGINLPEFDESDTRASMDGQVSADMSYSEWLTKQSKARQTEVLGVKRVELLRSGKLTMNDMYGSKGQYLTLKQLEAKL